MPPYERRVFVKDGREQICTSAQAEVSLRWSGWLPPEEVPQPAAPKDGPPPNGTGQSGADTDKPESSKPDPAKRAPRKSAEPSE